MEQDYKVKKKIKKKDYICCWNYVSIVDINTGTNEKQMLAQLYEAAIIYGRRP